MANGGAAGQCRDRNPRHLPPVSAAVISAPCQRTRQWGALQHRGVRACCQFRHAWPIVSFHRCSNRCRPEYHVPCAGSLPRERASLASCRSPKTSLRGCSAQASCFFQNNPMRPPSQIQREVWCALLEAVSTEATHPTMPAKGFMRACGWNIVSCQL